MWKPSQRIRYSPSAGRWPTIEQAAGARLFSPIYLNKLKLASRIWVPAMVPWRARETGETTQDVIEWYRRFAQGQPGAIVVEATGIRDIPSGPLLRIGHDRFIEGLRKIVDAVHDASDGKTRVFIQLIDFLAIRRRPDPSIFFDRYLQITNRHRDTLGLSAVPESEVRRRLATLPGEDLKQVLDAREYESLTLGYRERVTDMHLPHIADLPKRLPKLFADAARRAQEAGFDGVELHYAHAYTMASFLSALNTREDGYGGSRENRVRLALEAFQAVRAGTGNDFPVGCRFLAEDCVEGGNTVEDAAYFGVEFARAGMDFISTSRGGRFEDAAQPAIGAAAYPYTGRSGYECMPQHISDEIGPFGRNVEPTRKIRNTIRAAGCATPVVVTGGIHNFDQAEAILTRGDADIVGMARQSLADPDWPRKVRGGHGASVRLCEYTNYCEGLDQKHKQVTCKLWDRIRLDEQDVRLSQDGKRRLVAPAWRE